MSDWMLIPLCLLVGLASSWIRRRFGWGVWACIMVPFLAVLLLWKLAPL